MEKGLARKKQEEEAVYHRVRARRNARARDRAERVARACGQRRKSIDCPRTIHGIRGRGSGRGRCARALRRSCGIASERVGVRAALFVQRRAVFRISARTARTDGGPPPVRGLGIGAALPRTRWWVAVGCDISYDFSNDPVFEFLSSMMYERRDYYYYT